MNKDQKFENQNLEADEQGENRTPLTTFFNLLERHPRLLYQFRKELNWKNREQVDELGKRLTEDELETALAKLVEEELLNQEYERFRIMYGNR